MRFSSALNEHAVVIGKLEGILGLTYEPAISMLFQAFATGKKVLLCGNGGSCAQAAHFAAELSVRFSADRRALAALSLAESCSLSACANDYGFDHVFARQVEALGQPGDALVGISTSGKSVNVNEAIRKAKHLGLGTLGLSGCQGLEAGADVDVVVPSRVTARIQEAHALIVHLLCEGLEERLPKGEDPKWRT